MLSTTGGGDGYLLKDRVSRVDEFIDALRRVAPRWTPRSSRNSSSAAATRSPALTSREREVLGLMAQGHDNHTIAHRLVITDNAVHKHIGNVFTELGLAVSDSGHRRVLVVLTFLNGAGQVSN